MSTITNITDYKARLLALLPSQFQEGANWASLLEAIAGSSGLIQEQEDLIYSLWQQRADLDSAVGRQLDQWGELLNLRREGWSDDAYRRRLLVYVQVQRSRGTPDELIRITAEMLNIDVAKVYLSEHPVGYSVSVEADTYTDDSALALDLPVYLSEADAAGVPIGQVAMGPATNAWIIGEGRPSEEGGTSYEVLGTDLATEAGV